MSHIDKPDTHIISVIINVAQVKFVGYILNQQENSILKDIDEDWPLLIKDHQGNDHEIILKAGMFLLNTDGKIFICI